MKFGNNTLAPLLLFVYNRPVYTQRVLDALASNPEAGNSLLYIYCDGAKAGANENILQKIEKTREIVRAEYRFKEVIIIEQDYNKGLANSVISGVSDVCNKHGSVIVLEDDIVTSPFFLRYMNDALEIYKHISNVTTISGYWYPTTGELPETFFLKTPACWGWATWARAWKTFENDGNKLLSELKEKKLTRKFDLNGSIKYTRMLEEQILGKNNSWAIKWDAMNFINNNMCLYPGKSLVQNIGFEGDGVHSAKENYYDASLSEKAIIVSLLPVEECSIALKALMQFYKKINRANLIQRIKRLSSLFKFNKTEKT